MAREKKNYDLIDYDTLLNKTINLILHIQILLDIQNDDLKYFNCVFTLLHKEGSANNIHGR